MTDYDAWLEAPYQRMYAQEPPAEIEELLGSRLMKDGEVGWVVGYEPWEDEDEDGRHGGVDLVVRWEGSTRTDNLRPDEVEMCLLPASEQYKTVVDDFYFRARVYDLMDEDEPCVFSGTPEDAEAWVAAKDAQP